MSEKVVVGGVQMRIDLGNKDVNLNRMLSWLDDSRLCDARVVVFPECALTGYGFDSKPQALASAETIAGPYVSKLAERAAKTGKFIAFGMLERADQELFNSCVLLGPGGRLACYHKTHLPFLGADRFVSPGSQPPPVVDLGFLRLGIHICYDASFPESTRLLMLAGADLAILPTNWPTDAQVFSKHLAPVRAMENQMYFMVVNRVGEEGGFEFIGQSCLYAPSGTVLAEGDDKSEGVLVGVLEPEQARNKKIVRVPGQHEIHRIFDRRPDLYSAIVRPGAASR